jgi:CRISPR-associated protein Cas1
MARQCAFSDTIVLESQVRMQVVATGLDPTIGILHGNARGQHGLVFDLMEPLRPMVDRLS